MAGGPRVKVGLHFESGRSLPGCSGAGSGAIFHLSNLEFESRHRRARTTAPPNRINTQAHAMSLPPGADATRRRAPVDPEIELQERMPRSNFLDEWQRVEGL